MSAHPGALAVSRDGRVAAHVDAAGAVKVWNARSTLALEGLPAGQAPASAVGLSADGQSIVVGHPDGRVVLWQRGAATPLREFRGHAGRILALSLSDDGRMLASGSADGTTQVFELATGKRLQVLDSVYSGHPVEGVAMPVSVAFAAKDSRLVTLDWQRRQYEAGRVVALWDVEQGVETVAVPIGPPGGDEVMQAGQALGAGGWLLAYTSEKQLMVQRLDVCAPPQPVAKAGSQGLTGGRLADSVAADPLGRWVLATAAEAAHFFAVAVGREARVVRLPGRALALVPAMDGRSVLALLYTNQRDGTNAPLLSPDAPGVGPAQLFRVEVPADLQALPPLAIAASARPCPVSEEALRAQGFGVPERPAALAVVRRLAPALPLAAGEAELPMEPVRQLRFDARGRLHALFLDQGDSRSGVQAWDLADGRSVLARRIARQGEYAQPHWLGMDWAVLDRSGWLVRAGSGQRLLNLGDTGYDALQAADAQTGTLYRVTGSSVVAVGADGRPAPGLALRGPATGLAARAGRLLVLYRNGDTEWFEGLPMTSRGFLRAKNPAPPEDQGLPLDRLELSADGRFALAWMSSSKSETPDFDFAWRVKDGQAVPTGLAQAELPAAANRVVTADARAHRLAVWDFERNAAIARLPRQRSRDKQGLPVLLKAAISDDGKRVASASADGLVRVWDIDARRLLGEVRIGAEVSALAFDASARQLAVGRADAQVWVLALP